MTSGNPQEEMATARQPSTALAALAGFAAVGLGYVYVGRLRAAFFVILSILGVVTVFAWSRLILQPAGLVAAGAILLAIGIVSVVHPAIIAHRSGELELKPYNRWWVYVLWIIGLTLMGNLFGEFRSTVFGFDQFRIVSGSMATTLQRNDFILVDTWRYRDDPPALDDIAVFDLPDGRGTKYVYRIVGLPGDTISIDGNVLFRNGVAVEEPFILIVGGLGPLSEFAEIRVPDDHYFLLGDNRHNARDSRFIGPIPKGLLHGRAEFRWFASDWSRFPHDLTPDST